MSGLFRCVPLTSDIKYRSLINSFTIDREQQFSTNPDKVIGLEAYLKRCAWDEGISMVR